MKIKENYCSPSAKDNGPTCLSKDSLKMLIDTYNKSKKNKRERISYYDNNKQIELFKKLDNKLKKLTNGSGKYWLWPDLIAKMSPIDKYNLKLIKKNNIIPEMPKSWHKNIKEWLSNYDIDNVMFQYNNAKKYSEYAIKSLVSNNGYLQKNSEILNNSINVWKYDQDMLNECKKTIPKYI